MENFRDFSGKTIALDFDGVLHSYTSGWTGRVPVDGPEPGALDFVNWLVALGARVVVVSSRASTRRGAWAVRSWLHAHGFPKLQVTHRKVIAVAYVDDRAVPYQSGGWAGCREEVMRLTVRDNGPHRL